MTATYISFDRLIIKKFKLNQIIYICVMSNGHSCYSTTKKKCKKQILNFFGQKLKLPTTTKRLDFSLIQVENNKIYKQLAKFTINSTQINESLNKKQSFILSDQNYVLYGCLKKHKNISEVTIEQTQHQFYEQQLGENLNGCISWNPQIGRILTPKGLTINSNFFIKQNQINNDAKSDISPSKSSKIIFPQASTEYYIKKKTTSTGIQFTQSENAQFCFKLNNQKQKKKSLSPQRKPKTILKDIGNSIKLESYKQKIIIGGIIGLFSGLMAATQSF